MSDISSDIEAEISRKQAAKAESQGRSPKAANPPSAWLWRPELGFLPAFLAGGQETPCLSANPLLLGFTSTCAPFILGFGLAMAGLLRIDLERTLNLRPGIWAGNRAIRRYVVEVKVDLHSALAQFSSMESVKERVRDVGWESTVESLWQDLRYGVRAVCRNVGLTVAAVLALALGIGVNTAVFTAYKAMVARSLDARDPGEMVNRALVRQSGAATFTFSYPDYEAYRDSVRSFGGLIAFSPEHMTLSNAGGIVSQRTSAAESGVGKLGLLSRECQDARSHRAPMPFTLTR